MSSLNVANVGNLTDTLTNLKELEQRWKKHANRNTLDSALETYLLGKIDAYDEIIMWLNKEIDAKIMYLDAEIEKYPQGCVPEELFDALDHYGFVSDLINGIGK